MKPNKQFEISIQRLQNLKNQANQELSEGIRSNEAALFGELIVQQFIPHGLKSFTRKIGSG